MPGKIVHIALKVKDLESSTKFYEDVFGFRQVTTHRGKYSGHVSRHDIHRFPPLWADRDGHAFPVNGNGNFRLTRTASIG